VIYGLGMLDLGLTFDYTKLVIDNEIAYMIKHAVKGIPVSDFTLAVDIIKEVGPGGEFVSNMHTFKNFKETQSLSKLIDRRNRNDWERLGSKGIVYKANQIACNLYDNYIPKQLSDDVKKQLRDIVNESEEHYGVELSKE